MQYDNEYTRKKNAATRKRGRKKIKQMTGVDIDKMGNQLEKGKKVLSKFTGSLKVGHHTTVKSGDSVTETYTDSTGKTVKVKSANKNAGHNTTIKTGGNTNRSNENKNVGHNTTIKTGGNINRSNEKKKHGVGHQTTIKTHQINRGGLV